MDTISEMPTGAAREAGAFGGSFSARLAAALDGVFTWMERARQRQALAALDDRLLKDVGLSRADMVDEAGKPFWR